jgi:serine/threonine protein kinase
VDDAKGRVVIVDFGLAQQLAATTDRTVRSREVLGTPEFMSPEQAAGEPLTEASDWYSVGAMLYRALTGVSVFRGRYPHVLYDKMQHEAAPPREIVPGLPEDLNLCAGPSCDAIPPSARQVTRCSLVWDPPRLTARDRSTSWCRRERRPSSVATHSCPGCVPHSIR